MYEAEITVYDTDANLQVALKGRTDTWRGIMKVVPVEDIGIKGNHAKQCIYSFNELEKRRKPWANSSWMPLHKRIA